MVLEVPVNIAEVHFIAIRLKFFMEPKLFASWILSMLNEEFGFNVPIIFQTSNILWSYIFDNADDSLKWERLSATASRIAGGGVKVCI